MSYQRDISTSLIIYDLTYALFLIVSYFIIVSENYTYLIFIAVAILIRDFLFPIHRLFINDSDLTIVKLFAGGLIRKNIKVQRSKIISLRNIDAGITTDSIIDFEYGVFAPDSSDNQTKKYERYRIEYIEKSGKKESIKIPLSKIEVKSLSKTRLC